MATNQTLRTLSVRTPTRGARTLLFLCPTSTSALALAHRTVPVHARLFATSPTATAATHRALVFRQPGALPEALSAQTFRALPAPGAGRVNLRVRLAPVNPSDVNVVEGVYPNRPAREVLAQPDGLEVEGAEGEVSVPGNEGVAEVTAVGEGVCGLRVGERVVFAKGQPGTWAGARQVGEGDVIKVDEGVGDVTAATLSVSACVRAGGRGCAEEPGVLCA